jgi:hypothetical protein
VHDAVKRYLAGGVPLKRVFLYDMLLMGTMINFAVSVAALAASSLDVPAWVAIAIYLSPQPYNLILCVAVWRSAAQSASAWTDLARVGACAWVPLMLVI